MKTSSINQRHRDGGGSGGALVKSFGLFGLCFGTLFGTGDCGKGWGTFFGTVLCKGGKGELGALLPNAPIAVMAFILASARSRGGGGGGACDGGGAAPGGGVGGIIGGVLG